MNRYHLYVDSDGRVIAVQFEGADGTKNSPWAPVAPVNQTVAGFVAENLPHGMFDPPLAFSVHTRHEGGF